MTGDDEVGSFREKERRRQSVERLNLSSTRSHQPGERGAGSFSRVRLIGSILELRRRRQCNADHWRGTNFTQILA